MKFLLDTNICIAMIRNKPADLIKKLTTHKPGDVCVSVITVAELVHGAQKSNQPEKNMAALDQFLLPLEVADFDPGTAAVYGEIRANLEKAGTPIGSMDMLIAAHALSLGVVLVTNNTREFQRVPNLKIEDWLG